MSIHNFPSKLIFIFVPNWRKCGKRKDLKMIKVNVLFYLFFKKYFLCNYLTYHSISSFWRKRIRTPTVCNLGTKVIISVSKYQLTLLNPHQNKEDAFYQKTKGFEASILNLSKDSSISSKVLFPSFQITHKVAKKWGLSACCSVYFLRCLAVPKLLL